jgi:hypothetical protein
LQCRYGHDDSSLLEALKCELLQPRLDIRSFNGLLGRRYGSVGQCQYN